MDMGRGFGCQRGKGRGQGGSDDLLEEQADETGKKQMDTQTD